MSNSRDHVPHREFLYIFKYVYFQELFISNIFLMGILYFLI